MFHFYLRTSCEVRRIAFCVLLFANEFLLTHLLRGATIGSSGDDARIGFLLMRLLRGTTRSGYPWCSRPQFLLTHLLRGATTPNAYSLFFSGFLLTHLLRGATKVAVDTLNARQFLLTHLLRGATEWIEIPCGQCVISTHAPLTRCDRMAFQIQKMYENFYSRTSYEVRPASVL